MKLNHTTAQKIVQRTMKIIGSSVNVMDENGIIIASGDVSRLQQKHIGAIIAIRENRIVEIDDELAKQWNFEVRTGINLPINYLGKILGVVGISGIPEQVKPYAELVKMTAELIIEQHILLEAERWQRRYKEEFVLQLIKGELSTEQIEQQAVFFEFNFAMPRRAIIIKLCHTDADKLQTLVTYLEHHYPKQPLAVLGLDQVVLLIAKEHIDNFIHHKQLNRLLPPDSTTTHYKIAIGAETQLHFPIALSFQTALNTLHYGEKMLPKRAIYLFDVVKFPVLFNVFANSWQAKELLKPLQPLYEFEQFHLLRKTLQQYFLSNCDLVHSSEKLFIHINTLRYRLNKIEQITGLSFNNIEQKFILYLGTILY